MGPATAMEEALRADQVTNHVVHSFFGCDYRPLGNWGVVTRETALSIVQGLFGLELLGAKRLLTSRLAHFAKRTTKPNYPDVLVLKNYDPPIIKDARTPPTLDTPYLRHPLP
eukprot:g16911.t1